MTRWWPLLLVLACAGCELADADELLFGPPVGSGVVSLPFDATQSPGCMSWDGTNIDTNPSNPACAGGGGSPAPTVTPFACGTGYAVQVVGATPGCVLLPTPDGAGAGAAATQTPWSCGAGNGARGMGGTPECFVVPTPDGAGGGGATPGAGTPQPIATSTSAPGSADGFARVDHVHHLADGAIGAAKLAFTVPTPDGVGPTVGAGTPQPLATSTAMPGTSSNFARMDHVHHIADGAIGAAKLAFTVPTPDGTPNPGDVTAVGSCTDGACLTDGKATSGSTLFVWEGSTVDGNQLTINAGSSDPAAAHILVVPDTDGILVATVDGAEQDPQVGTRTSGAYCKGDGSAVQCTTTTVELASGGTGTALTDPNADRIMFWDDSAGATAYLEPSTGLAIQGTAIVAVTPVYYATPTPVPTPGSDPALAAGQCAWALGYDGLVCEGSTANTIETHLVAANPTTSDKTITLPDATGTVALLEQSQTFTGVNTFTNDVVIGGGTQTTLQQTTVQSGYDFYFTDGSGNGAQFTAASDLFAPYGTGTVRANDVSCASAPCVTLSSEVTGTLPLANGGTGAALTDPNADRIMFWDDSAGATAYLAPSTGLAIQGTAIVAVTPVYYVTPTPVQTPGSNPTMAAGQAYWADGYAGIVSEGATANQIEGWITFPDWASSDKTIAFPDETGTVCTTGSVCTGYMGTATVLGTSQNSTIHGNDDTDRCYGTDTDWCVEYDEAGNNQLIWATNANGTGTTTNPQFVVVGDNDTASGTNMTADQQIFGVCKGTDALLDCVATVDEDGDVALDGTLTGDVNTGADTLVLPITAATPAPTPTTAGRVQFNTYTKTLTVGDGTNAVKVNSFVHGTQATIVAGASTTAYYSPFLATGAQNPGVTENQRQDVAPVDLWCDEIRVCGGSTDAAAEDVTITVRDDGVDTALTCSMDGDSGTSTCTGASTKKGCYATLATPVLFARDSLTSIKIQCAGASCPSTNLVWYMTFRCWAGS